MYKLYKTRRAETARAALTGSGEDPVADGLSGTARRAMFDVENSPIGGLGSHSRAMGAPPSPPLSDHNAVGLVCRRAQDATCVCRARGASGFWAWAASILGAAAPPLRRKDLGRQFFPFWEASGAPFFLLVGIYRCWASPLRHRPTTFHPLSCGTLNPRHHSQLLTHLSVAVSATTTRPSHKLQDIFDLASRGFFGFFAQLPARANCPTIPWSAALPLPPPR